MLSNTDLEQLCENYGVELNAVVMKDELKQNTTKKWELYNKP